METDDTNTPTNNKDNVGNSIPLNTVKEFPKSEELFSLDDYAKKSKQQERNNRNRGGRRNFNPYQNNNRRNNNQNRGPYQKNQRHFQQRNQRYQQNEQQNQQKQQKQQLSFLPFVYTPMEVIWFNSSHTVVKCEAIKKLPEEFQLSNYFYDQSELDRLNNERVKFDSINPKKYNFLRNYCNPYEVLSKGSNVSKSALKFIEINNSIRYLSNAVKGLSCFHIFTDAGGILNYYYEVCKSYNVPIACYGLCLNIMENSEWDVKNVSKYLNETRLFKMLKSDSNDTNILMKYNREFFVKTVLSDFPEGIYLFEADGEYTGNSNENSDLSIFKQLCSEIVIGCSILSKNGIMIIKIIGCRNLPFISLLHLLSSMFDEISIVKPHSSRPASMELFMILKGYNNKNEELINEIDNVIDSLPSFVLSDEKYPVESLENLDTLLQDTSYVEFIKSVNDKCLKREADMCQLINEQNVEQKPVERLSEEQKKEILKSWGL